MLHYHSIEEQHGRGWRNEAPALDYNIEMLIEEFVDSEVTQKDYVSRMTEYLEIAEALTKANLLSKQALTNYQTINNLVLEFYKDRQEDEKNGRIKTNG